MFSLFGKIQGIELNPVQCMAIVTYISEQEAIDACQLDNAYYRGQNLSVKLDSSVISKLLYFPSF